MLLTDDLAVASTNLLAGSFLPTFYLLSSAMSSQRDSRPLNQLVADNFQKIIISETIAEENCYDQAKSFEREHSQRVFE